MRYPVHEHAKKIAILNDRFRQTFRGGKIILGDKVRTLSYLEKSHLVQAIKMFSDFNSENDPYREHDFGCVLLNTQRYYFRICCYDLQLQGRSANPHIVGQTRRILIITRLDEIQTTSIHDWIYLNKSNRYCFKKSIKMLPFVPDGFGSKN